MDWRIARAITYYADTSSTEEHLREKLVGL
jgi:hypothetical protein